MQDRRNPTALERLQLQREPLEGQRRVTFAGERKPVIRSCFDGRPAFYAGSTEGYHNCERLVVLHLYTHFSQALPSAMGKYIGS